MAGILDPQLKYIADRYNQQALGTTNAISGLTGSYAGLLGQIGGGTQAMFEQARSPVAAAAAGVNAQIAHTGAQTAATEAQSAQQAGLPQGAGGADVSPAGLTQTGKGAGGAAGAIGQATIDALTGAQKAAMTYAGKLPGFAALRGDYETQTALSQIAGQMADSLAQTAAQAPQLYYTIYQNLLDRADKDKSFRESVREWNISQKQRQQQIDQQTAQRKAGIVGPNAPTVAGQKRYWDAIAAQRTQDTGYLWQGTNTGIRPVDVDPKKPGIQTQVTLQGQAASAKLGTPIVRTSGGYVYTYMPGDPKADAAGWVRTGKGPKPSAPPAPKTGGVYYQDPTGAWHLNPKYRIVNGEPQLIPKPAKGTTAQKSGVFGTAPHKNQQGQWVTRKGRVLSPAGQKYWDWLLKQGSVDVAGHVRKPTRTGTTKTGGPSGKPPGVS